MKISALEKIGFDAISTIVHHPDFESVPKILETPYIPSVTKAKKSYAPYKYEIEMLRNNRFDPKRKTTSLQIVNKKLYEKILLFSAI